MEQIEQMQQMACNFSLNGKTALVTGARTGIGQAIAVGLAHAGANVILHGHQSNLRETEELVDATGKLVDSVLFDLRNPKNVQIAYDQLLAHHQIDILVNNAGIIRREPTITYSEENWNDVINVNMNSLFLLSQKLAKPMVERGFGKIINIASLLSFQGGINVAAYTASKHAVTGLTKAMANEWASSNVQVNGIAPGYISTNNTLALRHDHERSESILSRIPAGRWGRPEDLIGAAVFLASTASNYVNGQTLVVDGGWMAR